MDETDERLAVLFINMQLMNFIILITNPNGLAICTGLWTFFDEAVLIRD